ncbi:MAG: hypothetical protein KAU62_17015 [Candidatus Heimdallarchaeota archaeon]|nr:hypothetical protein [Candidatus Heimdallarchaeota archaeon]MCK4612860.1 hypothetical protein [Candidatus Heimdallarchaeota archaeon]
MIHLVAFIDIEIGLGRTIYQDNTLQVSEALIWPMISALNNFVIECTASDRGLVNAALEDIKIYLYSPLGESNPLRIVFFTDLFDNNEYLEKKGQAIFSVLSKYISFETFDPPTEIIGRAKAIAKYTQNFPTEILNPQFLDELKRKLKNLEEAESIYVADFFIGDIDQGKVFTFIESTELQEKDSVLLFSELLTAFSIDSEIFVKSSLSKKERDGLENLDIDTNELMEGWFLRQLSDQESDFWLVCYFYYDERREEEVKQYLNWATIKIKEELSVLNLKRPF